MDSLIASCDPQIVGREVYFVCPPPFIVTELVPDLIRRELAVAVLGDSTFVETLALRHPHAVFFINIDEGGRPSEWAARIEQLQTAQQTSDIKIGILSQQIRGDEAHRYVLDLAVAGGFHRLVASKSESWKTVGTVLESLQARGRRQFLRIPCRHGQASFNWATGGKTLSATIVDVSVVGLSCLFDDDPDLVAHSLLRNIQIKLRGSLGIVSAVVMGTRPINEQVLYVLIFDQPSPEVREKIRTFQTRMLQQILDEELKA